MNHANEDRSDTQTDYDKKDAFANDDNSDPDQVLEAVIDKRKFLMERLFSDMRPTNTV